MLPPRSSLRQASPKTQSEREKCVTLPALDGDMQIGHLQDAGVASLSILQTVPCLHVDVTLQSRMNTKEHQQFGLHKGILRMKLICNYCKTLSCFSALMTEGQRQTSGNQSAGSYYPSVWAGTVACPSTVEKPSTLQTPSQVFFFFSFWQTPEEMTLFHSLWMLDF